MQCTMKTKERHTQYAIDNERISNSNENFLFSKHTQIRVTEGSNQPD